MFEWWYQCSSLCLCAGIGAGETAIESLLSTNPDPDHVTLAHAGEGPASGAVADHSPTPSIDSDKENNIEMVNLLQHPNTSGKLDSPHGLKERPASTYDGAADEKSQQEEVQLAKDELKPPTKVCDSLVRLLHYTYLNWHLILTSIHEKEV